MAEFHTCIPVRKKYKTGTMSFNRAESTEEDFENVPIKLEDFASLFLRLENGARGNFTTCQVAQGRKVDININVFGSKGSYTWSHEHPSELLIGHREQANETFFESPVLQTEDTRKYATLPTGHPMGYHDAVLNLFREFYAAVASKHAGKYNETFHPDFKTGHVEMCIIEAAVESSLKGEWIKVRW